MISTTGEGMRATNEQLGRGAGSSTRMKLNEIRTWRNSCAVGS